MAPEIVVVGSLNMDMVARTARLPHSGETVLGTDFAQIPGGKGANQAVAAARLGAEVTMIGAVGDDEYGKTLLNTLKREKIRVEAVEIVPAPTGVAVIYVDEQGRNTIVVIPGANGALTRAGIRRRAEAIAGARVLVVQLESPLDAVEEALNIAREAGVTTLLNPAPARPLPGHWWSYLDIVTPNEHELPLLLGEEGGAGVLPLDEVKRLARRLIDLGAGAAVVTLGERGAVWTDGRAGGHRPADPVTPVDTTAAGDAFTGALAVAVAEGASLAEAVSFGCRAAGLSVTRLGAQPSLPYRWELPPQRGVDKGETV
ncbi:MAG: ribokinase [Kyrpidia sp.]|nr:ribokinase [Kyrpidia sp.]